MATLPRPRLGYLCLSENPSAEAGRALVRQFVLVREADRMGYDDIWFGEQHFDTAWPQGAIMALLGHLAAASSKARIGAMVLMPALREAVSLAEEVATLDLLSKGRFELGVASGAAFAATLQSRGFAADQARLQMRAVLDQVAATLSGQPVPGTVPPVALVPAPAQTAVPMWMAADDEQSLRYAAARGWGLMAAATHSRERVARAVRLYTEASGGRTPALVLARFACSADTADEARAIAAPYFDALRARAAVLGWGSDRTRSIAQDVEALMAESLIGRHADVAQQFRALAADYGATRVAIVPTTGQFDAHKHILAAFVDEVRPLLDD